MNDNGDYVSISIFESDECLSHHFLSFCPPYQKGQTFWFERDTVAGARFEHKAPIRLTKYEIIDIQHRISEHYHNNISVLFSVEIMVRKIGEKES